MRLKLLITCLVSSLYYSCQYTNNSEGKFQKALHPNQRYISLREAPAASEMLIKYEAWDKAKGNYSSKYELVKIDSSGFINPFVKKKDADFDIYFIGGSTTACYEVKNEFKFVNLVQDQLKNQYSITVNTFNAGNPGNSSISSYNKFLNVIANKKPEMVVMMHNFNDLSLMLYQGDYWSSQAVNRKIRKKVELLEDTSITSYYRFRNTLNQGTFPATKEVINNIISKLTMESSRQDEWKNQRRKPLNLSIDQIEQDFISSLKTFINSCRIYNCEPVLMTQANQFVPHPPLNSKTHQNAINIMKGSGFDYEKVRKHYEKFTHLIKQVAKEEKVMVIDLETSIPKDTNYLLDLVHLNQKGSQLAADIICQELSLHPLLINARKPL